MVQSILLLSEKPFRASGDKALYNGRVLVGPGKVARLQGGSRGRWWNRGTTGYITMCTFVYT